MNYYIIEDVDESITQLSHFTKGDTMNNRVKRSLCLFLTILMGLTACTSQTQNKPSVLVNYNDDLDALVPQMPASWIYSGTADYNQVMSLVEVIETSGQKIYKVYGEVEDTTGGEVQADFTFEKTYTVTGDRLEQTRKGRMLLDSEYDKLTLIKLPLEVGNTWNEKVIDTSGKTVGISAEIEAIEEVSDGKVYTVRYKQSGSKYYELRKIKEGSGVVHFEKIMFYDGDQFDLEYSLWHLNREETLIAKNSQNQVDESAKRPNPFEDATVIVLDTIPEASPGEVPTDDVKEELTGVIKTFNKAWTLFANEENRDVLDLVTKSGDTYDIIQRFPAGTMTLSFELIDVGEVRVEGDRANLYVHEIIKKETNDKTEMLEYFWLYDVRKVDGKWLVHSYVNQ